MRRFVVLCAVLALPLHALPRHRAAGTTAVGMAAVQRVMVVILENADLTAALQQPFLSQFANGGALLTNYYAIGHPSQPNYIALTAGSNWGVNNDTPVDLNIRHIGDSLNDRGMQWRVYSEDYPGDCFTGDSYSDDSSGGFVRRHVPFLDFLDVTQNADRCDASVVPARNLHADIASGRLPQFSLYIPDTVHDGHDTGVAAADAWLQRRFGPLLSDPRFMKNMLLVVVFDEGNNPGPNIVYCAMQGAGIAPGSTSSADYTHYSLLKTIEQIFNLGPLTPNDLEATPIHDIWQTR